MECLTLVASCFVAGFGVGVSFMIFTHDDSKDFDLLARREFRKVFPSGEVLSVISQLRMQLADAYETQNNLRGSKNATVSEKESAMEKVALAHKALDKATALAYFNNYGSLL